MSLLEDRLAEGLELLRRALDRARLYGVDHPEARQAIDNAWAPLEEVLRAGRPIVLESGLDGLRWQGRVLVKEDDDKEGLGRLLHREGIAELRLHPGTSREGMGRLLDVVRVNLALPEHEEETLESLLWQASIDGVSFRAVAALMEAEAISGDALRYMQARGGSRVDTLLASDGGHGASRGPVADDVVVQAIEQSYEQEAGPEALERGDDGAWEVEPEAWERSLADQAHQDAAAIQRMRVEVAQELPGDQVDRACALLFQAARSRRDELPLGEAMALAGQAVDEVMRQADAFALVQVVRRARQELHGASGDPELARGLQGLLQQATQPVPVARLLAAAGPSADPAATAELVGLLDDHSMRALIEWSFSPEAEGAAADRGRWLATALGDAAAERARGWLQDPATEPGLLVPAIELLRGRDAPQDRRLRPQLLAHPAGRVIELTLEWYVEAGLPAAEAPGVLALVEDRRPRIRKAACRALAAWPPPDLSGWFQARLSPQALETRPAAEQRALCVSCGEALGGRAVRPLTLLLERKVGLFAGRSDSAVLEAAAFGLAAVGSADARAVLEEGARSWVGARSQACKAALASMRGGPA